MGFDLDKIRRDNPLSDIIPKRGIALRKNGNEFEALCPFHNEKTPSFQVWNSKSGHQRYHCKGCGETGDVIEFVQSFDGVSFVDACSILGGEREASQRSTASVQRQSEFVDPYEGWTPKQAPAAAPVMLEGQKTPPLWNPKRTDEAGKVRQITYTPSMVFPYRAADGGLLGYVLRIEVEGGRKITPLLIWMIGPDGQEGWSHGRFPEPRPFYGLDRLAENPGWQVWVLEGEKKTDSLNRLFAAAGTKAVAVSWQGGSKAAAKSDWSWAAGRRVVLWPDADQPGIDAMAGWNDARGEHKPGAADLAHSAGATEIKLLGWDADKPSGWDAADAEVEGWTIADIIRWAKERLTVWEPRQNEQPPPADDPPMPDEDSYGSHEPPDYYPPSRTVTEARTQQQEAPERERPSNVVDLRGRAIEVDDWRSLLAVNEDNHPKPRSLQNVIVFLTHWPSLKGVYAWNSFAKRVFVVRRPPWEPEGNGGPYMERELTDTDVVRCTGYLESKIHLTPRVSDTQNGILAAAETNAFDPVADYLNGLVWDGISRLAGEVTKDGEVIPSWPERYLGTVPSPASQAFGLRWMIGAAARALNPGCKMDNMLILEGPQGKRKSTALRVLGTFPTGCFYTDEISDIGSKDAAMQLQGVLIIELAELDALGRAEVKQVKAWMSRQVDRFRPPFGRAVAAFPRHCVPAGTVNPGGVGYLNDATGARRFWPVTCGDIDIEALERDKAQLWAEAVARFKRGERWWLEAGEDMAARQAQSDRYEEDVWADAIDDYCDGRAWVQTRDIVTDCLRIETGRQDDRILKRVAKHLTARGWERKKRYFGTTGGGKWVYVRPDVE